MWGYTLCNSPKILAECFVSFHLKCFQLDIICPSNFGRILNFHFEPTWNTQLYIVMLRNGLQVGHICEKNNTKGKKLTSDQSTWNHKQSETYLKRYAVSICTRALWCTSFCMLLFIWSVVDSVSWFTSYWFLLGLHDFEVASGLCLYDIHPIRECRKSKLISLTCQGQALFNKRSEFGSVLCSITWMWFLLLGMYGILFNYVKSKSFMLVSGMPWAWSHT